MRFSGNDLVVIGMCLAMAGSIVMAKGIISKDMFMTLKESGTYLNQNMFQIKGSIFQKYESIIGGAYLFVGFLLNLIGVFMTVRNKHEDDVFLYSYWNILCFLMLTFLLIWVGLSISKRISMDKFTPLVKTEENVTTLKWALFILEHHGWYPEDYDKKDKINLTDNILSDHLTQAQNIIANMGLWLDTVKQSKESDIEFSKRIIDIYSRNKGRNNP